MKHLILDHLKRWGLIWLAVGIANYYITGSPLNQNALGMNPFSFQLIFWLGAFELNYDNMRGSSRVLTTLPVSAKRIGRAWWIFSVALPAIFLALTSALACQFHTSHAQGFPTNEFIVANMTNLIYLGSVFYLFAGSLPGAPQKFNAWVRLAFAIGFILAMLFVKPTLETPQGILFLLTCATLTVLGWFSAEQMVLRRASFRIVATSPRGKNLPHQVPQGFGGLPYLVQRVFVQSTLIGLAMIGAMVLFMAMLTPGHNRGSAILSMVQGGSTPYVFFILIFSIVPVVFQLRFLRTLPVSPSALAAALVALPVFSIITVGAIIATVLSLLLGDKMVVPTANSFLILGAKAAIIVPLIIWRGLDALTYFLIFLMVVADSFIALGMTLLFHLGSNTPANPWWSSAIIFLLFIAVALLLTRTLLIQSSCAYRVRNLPASSWNNVARR